MTKPPRADSEPVRPVEPCLVQVGALRRDPGNPRSITRQMLERLMKSLDADRDFLWHRPILADETGLIYAGSMRYEAAVRLGREAVPAVVEPVDDLTRRRRRLMDNLQFGEWSDTLLAEEVYALREEGVDLGVLGFEDKEIVRILALSGADGSAEQPEPKKVKCPGCGYEWVLP